MKVYVVGYDIRPEYKAAMAAGNLISGDESSDIFYSPLPQWTEPTREIAEIRIAELHRMKIHSGDHYCQLEVEQISDDEFAMVCNNHPQPPK